MILVTGATGYLGSHMVVELLKRGYTVHGIDNFINSDSNMLERIDRISENSHNFMFNLIDLSDRKQVDNWIEYYRYGRFSAIVHFAGLKSVPDSVQDPMEYYRNNLDCTMNVCRISKALGIKNIIFSSSSTVYCDSSQAPFDEYIAKTGGSSPYGWTKVMSEQILTDYCESTKNTCIMLRYFNPVGSHESGLLGDTNDNGLMVNILRAANGESVLPVFGDDYETPDGTCIRDYIHVDDLIDAHIRSIDILKRMVYSEEYTQVYNVGTGTGYTVLEMINAFSKITGKNVPYEIVGRRYGDPPRLIADPWRANHLLGWSPKKTLEDMCISAQNYYEKGVRHDSNNSST